MVDKFKSLDENQLGISGGFSWKDAAGTAKTLTFAALAAMGGVILYKHNEKVHGTFDKGEEYAKNMWNNLTKPNEN